MVVSEAIRVGDRVRVVRGQCFPGATGNVEDIDQLGIVGVRIGGIEHLVWYRVDELSKDPMSGCLECARLQAELDALRAKLGGLTGIEHVPDTGASAPGPIERILEEVDSNAKDARLMYEYREALLPAQEERDAALAEAAEWKRLKDHANAALAYEKELTKRAEAECARLREALNEARSAMEPFDDVKPRRWETDYRKLADAHKAARKALASSTDAKGPEKGEACD